MKITHIFTRMLTLEKVLLEVVFGFICEQCEQCELFFRLLHNKPYIKYKVQKFSSHHSHTFELKRLS